MDFTIIASQSNKGESGDSKEADNLDLSQVINIHQVRPINVSGGNGHKCDSKLEYGHKILFMKLRC